MHRNGFAFVHDTDLARVFVVLLSALLSDLNLSRNKLGAQAGLVILQLLPSVVTLTEPAPDSTCREKWLHIRYTGIEPFCLGMASTSPQ